MLQHKSMGHGGRTGGVHPVAQFLQQMMVFHQIIGDAVHRHLVG